MQSIMQRCLCGWCQSDNYIQCHTDFSLKGLKCVVFQTCSYLRLFYLISLKKIKMWKHTQNGYVLLHHRHLLLNFNRAYTDETHRKLKRNEFVFIFPWIRSKLWVPIELKYSPTKPIWFPYISSASINKLGLAIDILFNFYVIN
jgi:hypothetical protein